MIKENIEYAESDSIMIMCDNRELLVYKEIKEINMKYCVKHHINFRYYSAYDINISPYWWKVFLIRDLITQYSDTIKYICWMDSDAIVCNTNTHFKDFFNNETDNIYFIGPRDTLSSISIISKIATKLGYNIDFQASVFF